MRKASKILMGGALAIAGIAAGAALNPPTLATAQETTTTTVAEEASDRIAAFVTRIREALQNLVDDGVITATQADAVADDLGQELPSHGFHLRGVDVLGVAAEAIGIDEATLAGQLRDGGTLAEIAADNGSNAQTVIDAITAAWNEHIDEKVADGQLTTDQAEELRADLATRVEELVNGEFGFGPGFGHHGHGGLGGFPVPDNTSDATTDT